MEAFIGFGPFFLFENISWFENIFGFETFFFDLEHYLAQKNFSWFEKYLMGFKKYFRGLGNSFSGFENIILITRGGFSWCIVL